MVTEQLTLLYRRAARALGAISGLFLAGLALTLVGIVWLAVLGRAGRAIDAASLEDGARLAQSVLVAERSYQRYLMTGERELLKQHREANAEIELTLGRLNQLALRLLRW